MTASNSIPNGGDDDRPGDFRFVPGNWFGRHDMGREKVTQTEARMAQQYKVTPIDFQDTSLAGAAEMLEDLLNGLCADGMQITAILPQRLSFSTPDPDSSYRDFHYTETGLLVVARRAI